MGEYDHVIAELPIYKAALNDDYDSVSKIFEQNPQLMIKRVTYWLETPLIIAVGTNCSHTFVQKLVERIVAAPGEIRDKLFLGDDHDNNPLHFAAKVGNMAAAKLLVEQNRLMVLYPNKSAVTPLKMAAWHGQKEALRYFLKMTPDKEQDWISDPYTGVAGGDLITLTIMAEFYDVALEIIDLHPNIVLEKDRNGETALQVLAMKPEAFPSGSKLGFWGRPLYTLMHVEKSQGAATKVNIFIRIFNKFAAGFWSALKYVAPAIKNIHDIKVNHGRSSLLVKRICDIVIDQVNHDMAWNILGSAIATALTYGTRELIEECLLTYPGLIWYRINGSNLFIESIKERQERVYNLVHQMSGHRTVVATLNYENRNNALHFAARLAPSRQLNVVTGAALQMQRELQWFKEIENFVELSYKEAKNGDGLTPRQVFTKSHENLLEKGQQWMKDTASSCTVVAALVVTMAFAAAFTMPGGNQDDGKPLFLNDGTFMLFFVSDAVALFSSVTSVLMFLGILTSRYAEEDFLYALPKRLTIGLLSLFLSLAATMIAFSAVLALVLRDKVTWIAAPLVIATGIPVCLFGLLQFPLLMELVNSTYGRSIFRQENAPMIH